MSLLSPVSPKHTPEPSVDFAEMLQIESKGSFGLHHFSHDLPRPENTKARDLDLQKSARPNPACPWHTQLFATPIAFKLKKKNCWTQISAPAAETNTPFILLLRKLRPKEVGVGGQMSNLRKSGKARQQLRSPAPPWNPPNVMLPSEKEPKFIHFSLACCLMFIWFSSHWLCFLPGARHCAEMLTRGWEPREHALVLSCNPWV